MIVTEKKLNRVVHILYKYIFKKIFIIIQNIHISHVEVQF